MSVAAASTANRSRTPFVPPKNSITKKLKPYPQFLIFETARRDFYKTRVLWGIFLKISRILANMSRKFRKSSLNSYYPRRTVREQFANYANSSRTASLKPKRTIKNTGYANCCSLTELVKHRPMCLAPADQGTFPALLGTSNMKSFHLRFPSPHTYTGAGVLLQTARVCSYMRSEGGVTRKNGYVREKCIAWFG